MNIDPLAERRDNYSPYAYCLNNPVLRLDPNGLTDFTFNKKTGEVKQVGEKMMPQTEFLKLIEKEKLSIIMEKPKLQLEELNREFLWRGKTLKIKTKSLR